MKNKKLIDYDFVDISDFLILLFAKKKFVITFTLILFILGICYSLIINPTYKSTISFSVITENSNSNSQFQSLASIAGININTKSNILNPNYFPIIFNNYNFKEKILNTNLGDNQLFKNFLQNKNSNFLIKFLSIPSKIFNISIHYLKEISNNNEVKNIINTDNSIQDGYYTVDDEILFNNLNSMINIEFNQKLNIIEISTVTTNPLISYIITNKTFELLQNKIIETNQKSSLAVLDFNIKNFNSKKEEFLILQDKLAKFRDSNQIISSSKFNNELSVIENEFNLVRSIYLELARQVELSKIEVTRDTPVFNILKDAYIPNKKFEPRRTYIVILFSLFGLISSITFIFLRYQLKLI